MSNEQPGKLPRKRKKRGPYKKYVKDPRIDIPESTRRYRENLKIKKFLISASQQKLDECNYEADEPQVLDRSTVPIDAQYSNSESFITDILESSMGSVEKEDGFNIVEDDSDSVATDVLEFSMDNIGKDDIINIMEDDTQKKHLSDTSDTDTLKSIGHDDCKKYENDESSIDDNNDTCNTFSENEEYLDEDDFFSMKIRLVMMNIIILTMKMQCH